VDENAYARLSKADMKYQNIQVADFIITPRGVAERDQPEKVLAQARSACVSVLMDSRLFENVKYVQSVERANGTLVVQAEMTSLRIVGTGARIWLGAMAGHSEMAVHVKLIDAATGAVIGEKDIKDDSNAYAGAYTAGSTDRSLPIQVGSLIADFAIHSAKK
jgi:hypothetical protein